MIVYASRTGNCEYIQKQLNLPSVKIENGLLINSPFFLLTYTDGIGKIPLEIENFMINNYTLCKGIVASGNSNFGHNAFCGSADKLSEMYGINIIRKIELRGFKVDYDCVIDEYNKIIGGE